MVGIVVATHGELGNVLLGTLKALMGETPGMVSVALCAGDPLEAFQGKFERALEEADPKGAGVLVLVDLLGGTPFNLAVRMVGSRKLHVVTGVNLPMVVKAASRPEGMGLEELAADLKGTAREGIVTSVELLKRKS